MIVLLAVAALGSVTVAFGASWLVAVNAPRLRLVDVPNARSSHTMATARGGGLGVAAGVIVGILLLSAFGDPPTRQLATVLAGAAAIASIGALDDLHPIRAGLRLMGQLLVATLVIVGVGGIPRLPFPPPLDLPLGWLAAPFAVLWLVSATNFYNFMDGIDGLAAGQAMVSCIGVAIAAWSHDVAAFAIVLAASSLGFLVLNRPPAKIFLGDVGSTAIGFTLAGLPLVAEPGQRSAAVLAVAVGLALFLLDPIETLLRLARHGRRIGSPHRMHSYQILARGYGSHAAVAVAMLTAGLVLSVAGAVAFRTPVVAWPAIILAGATFAVERYLAGRMEPSQEALSAT